MTKHIFHIMLVIFIGLSTISSCSDDELEEEVHTKRTVIAYITGDNNISSNLLGDIKEMISGSTNLPSDCRLVIFSDCKNSNPYIAEIKNGEEKHFYISNKTYREILALTNKKYYLHDSKLE